MGEELIAVRRNVPNDHSCLFWAIAYLTEGPNSSRAKARELREVCANDALNDTDPATRALLLGFNGIEEYAAWIRNEFHWGGENEVLALAKHYKCEIALVCCQSLQVLCYGSDQAGCNARIYLLYTGQHYDPIVAGTTAEVAVDQERRRFAKGDTSLETSALAVARQHNVEAERRAKQRRAKRIKCGGCGALLTDNEAFATHCSEVEHDDEFAYDCTEVEVVLEEGDELPEGAIDLNLDSVYTFTNTGKDILSNAFPIPVTVGGTAFPTLEHYWQAAPFLETDVDVAKRIAAAKTVDEAVMIAGGAPDSQRPDWRTVRSELLLQGLRAKAQNAQFVEALIATTDKTLVCLDSDPWAGMQAPDGLPSGQNNVGKALMTLRQELSALRSVKSL